MMITLCSEEGKPKQRVVILENEHISVSFSKFSVSSKIGL